jgi:sugar lactone lactonase YvrE
VKRGIPVFLFACTVALGQQYVAWTVAGGGPPFTPVTAVNAAIASGGSLATDAGGNVYIRSFQCVLKVDPRGILTLVAGNGRAGSAQDGVPATSAHLSASGPIATDPIGNIYTVDPSIRVRRISVNGTITTVAGNGTVGSSGDGGPATSAQFSEILSLAADGAGNFYVTDASATNRVRRVSANGIVTTVAGNGTAGFSGDGGPATSAALNIPRSVATDTAGNLYIADTGNNRIRKVSIDGIITTVAGNGVTGSTGDGGPATSASLFGPWSVAVDGAGDIYIGEQDFRVRKVSPAGIMTTVAGNGTYGISGDGGPAPFAQLGFAISVAADAAGNLFIADSVNKRVRKVSIYGTITTIAGNGTSGFSGDGGPALDAQFQLLSGLAVDAAGNLYIADSGNARVRKIVPNRDRPAGSSSGCHSGDAGAPIGRPISSPPASASAGRRRNSTRQ